jgi:superfamily II DNA/RNA helicase
MSPTSTPSASRSSRPQQNTGQNTGQKTGQAQGHRKGLPGQKSVTGRSRQHTKPTATDLVPKPDLFASFEQGGEPDLTATFADLGLSPRLVRELENQGILHPFPIQAATIADCLDGRDLLGRGRTGSGKTLAFSLPLLTLLSVNKAPRRPGRPRALVLAPTRELAIQIKTVMDPYARVLGLSTTTIFGGVGPNPQIKALRAGVDIVIACPGRLLDHLGDGHASLDSIEVTVLDEADHMADMGFLPDVKRLLDRTPRNSQRLLFSATLDNGIDALVKQYLHDPVLRSVDPVETVESKMTHHVLQIAPDDRVAVLRDLAAAPGRLLAFTRTKHGAKKLTQMLIKAGVPSVELHGNLSQNARTRSLEAFREGSVSALIATDVAARGIHVDDIELVVHFDPPVDHKAYLHRSGRTARAGAEGKVITFMTSSQKSEVAMLAKRAGISPITTSVAVGHPLLLELAPGERRFVEPSLAAPKTPLPNGPSRPPKRSGSGSEGAPWTRGSGGGAGGSGSGRAGQSRPPSRAGGGSSSRSGSSTRGSSGR